MQPTPQVIRYVDALNTHYAAQGHPPYQWTINTEAPLHRSSREPTVSVYCRVADIGRNFSVRYAGIRSAGTQ